MKAIRVHETGGPEVLKLEEVPNLQAGPGEVVVKVHAAGVNPVDTYFRAGGAYKPTLPYTPGMDAAGVVHQAGAGVSRVRDGQRVYVARSISGTYAEYVLCKQEQVRPLPDNVSFEQGAGVYVPYATAYRALFQRAQARPGETVLVHGASGGVGIAAVQVARAAGLTVIGTASTEEGRKLVAAEGAHHVLDHSKDDYVPKLMEVTNTEGAQVILEMTANVNLQKDLSMVAHGGRIVIIGSRGTIEIDPRAIMARDVTLLGMILLTIDNAAAEELHAALYAGLENGSYRPIVGKQFPLAQAAKSHIAVMERGAYGKIVLIP